MLYPIEFSLEELTLLRQSLDLIQISGKSAKMVAGLQEKFEEGLFQVKTNLQIQEQERIQAEEEKQKQLEALMAREAKKAAKTSAG